MNSNTIKLETVVVDNGRGGTVFCEEEEGILSGYVMLMQTISSTIGRPGNMYIVEETRVAYLVDDVSHIVLHGLKPGMTLTGNIVMKQRTSFAPGYSKMKGLNGRLLRDTEGNPIWGRTYYTEDEEDKDELIVDSKSL